MRGLADRLRRLLVPAGIRRMIAMGDLVTGSWVAQGIHVVAALGVADRMGTSPLAAGELAALVGANEDALYRVMRMLAAAGLFKEHSGKRFTLTGLGELLRSDHPNSMRAFAIYNGVPWHWEMWGDIERSVATGAPALAKGKPLFEYLALDPQAAATFDAAMADLSNARDVSAISGYDFGRFKTAIDVGGGEGRLIRSVLASYPTVSGILFDLPAVIERARPVIEREGFASRCSLVSGSFFETLPAGADAYMLKQVLHDWQDDKATLILASCRRAAGDTGVVLVIEMVVPDDGSKSLAKLSDIEMLVAVGGRERTLAQYRTLLAAAGLQIAGVHETRSPFSIIEARAAP
jgi:ubiquinone/menaquinone biosynthesis C-methylase UbiE